MSSIKPEFHKELDIEFRNKYKEYFGIDSNNDIGIKIFTLEEQIERYSKNLFFWRKEFIEIDCNSTDKTVARYLFTRSKYDNILKMVKTKFFKSVQDKIINTADKLFYEN